MDDMMKITLFLKRVDGFCARMNAGLSAVAIVLAAMVVSMSVIRASDIAIDLGANAPVPYSALSSDTPIFNSWTYD
ncbi:MAG TPA: hypothetical protein VNF99_16825 [Stellaceae bacterium]|nr:hypothetical protein [Stellaceae bacterium]